MDKNVKFANNLSNGQVCMLAALVVGDVQLNGIDIDWGTHGRHSYFAIVRISTAKQDLMVG